MCHCFNKKLLLGHNCVKKKKPQKYRGNVYKLHDYFKGNYLGRTHDSYFPMKGSLLNWINTLLIAKFHCPRLLSSHHFQNKPISYFLYPVCNYYTKLIMNLFPKCSKKNCCKEHSRDAWHRITCSNEIRPYISPRLEGQIHFAANQEPKIWFSTLVGVFLLVFLV